CDRLGCRDDHGASPWRELPGGGHDDRRRAGSAGEPVELGEDEQLEQARLQHQRARLVEIAQVLDYLIANVIDVGDAARPGGTLVPRAPQRGLEHRPGVAPPGPLDHARAAQRLTWKGDRTTDRLY